MSNVEKALSNLAEETLREAKIKDIPIPVTKIAEYYGFSVFEATMADGDSGLIYISDKAVEKYGTNKIIMINRKESEVRKKFTIAHELGHFILNDKPTDCYAHRDQSFVNFEETMANGFASYLLMPEKELNEYIHYFNNNYWIDGNRSAALVYSVSRKFLVSKDAARVRLQKIGEIQ